MKRLFQAALRFAPSARHPAIIRFETSPPQQRKFQETAPSLDQLPVEHALRVKSAELWLRLGRPGQAIVELRRLSRNSRRHPLALKGYLQAARALREMNGVVAPA